MVDLAKAHVVAIQRLLEQRNLNNYEVFNIGTGTGSSVLECVKTFELVNNVKIKYEIGKRRAGDIVKVWADTKKANEILGWEAKLDLKEMLRSAWQWQLELRE